VSVLRLQWLPMPFTRIGLRVYLSTYSFLGHVFLFGSYDGHVFKLSVFTSHHHHIHHIVHALHPVVTSPLVAHVCQRDLTGPPIHLFVVPSWVISFLLGLMMGIMHSSICLHLTTTTTTTITSFTHCISGQWSPVHWLHRPVYQRGLMDPPIRLFVSWVHVFFVLFWVLCWVYVI